MAQERRQQDRESGQNVESEGETGKHQGGCCGILNFWLPHDESVCFRDRRIGKLKIRTARLSWSVIPIGQNVDCSVLNQTEHSCNILGMLIYEIYEHIMLIIYEDPSFNTT